MELKNGLKQGRDERTQEDLLHSFISALFLYLFQLHPYLKSSFTETFSPGIAYVVLLSTFYIWAGHLFLYHSAVNVLYNMLDVLWNLFIVMYNIRLMSFVQSVSTCI